MWTLWIAVISAFVAACCGALSILGAVAAHRHARDSREASSADRGTPLLKSQVSGLGERVEAMEEILQRIDARDRMRKVRAGARTSEPDPFSDPAAWKAKMRAAKAAGGS